MRNRRRRRSHLLLNLVLLLMVVIFLLGALALAQQLGFVEAEQIRKNCEPLAVLTEWIGSAVDPAPKEVTHLRKQTLEELEAGLDREAAVCTEYYYSLIGDEEERKVYREMEEGIRNRETSIYLTTGDPEEIDRIYHAFLKDHPEYFWVHNREYSYKTTYENLDYAEFKPGYSYTDAEVSEIRSAMETAYQNVLDRVQGETDAYEKIKAVYTYLIDETEYVFSDHDQSIAGVFWKKEAVCAGYAGAMQYLLERLGIPCIYVEGDAKGSDDGHAWNIVLLNGDCYIVDVTNGDQPSFFEGAAAFMEEHKTILYDYLCPFPQEYGINYSPSGESPVPECTKTDLNFYSLNDALFDTCDFNRLYDYCCMRLNNGAAVVRFKFSNKEAFEQARADWLGGEGTSKVAQYYMSLYGQGQVEYHYGVLEDLNTIYYMF